MKLIPQFIAAVFAKPEPAVADLESLTHVSGGSGLRMSVPVSRFGYVGTTAYVGTEKCDLHRNEAGEWDLVLSKQFGLQNKPMTETVGTFATLGEAVPFLRAASDILKEKYRGFWAAAGGYSYSESGQGDGIAAVERALALKKEIQTTPQPRL